MLCDVMWCGVVRCSGLLDGEQGAGRVFQLLSPEGPVIRAVKLMHQGNAHDKHDTTYKTVNIKINICVNRNGATRYVSAEGRGAQGHCDQGRQVRHWFIILVLAVKDAMLEVNSGCAGCGRTPDGWKIVLRLGDVLQVRTNPLIFQFAFLLLSLL